MPHHLPATCQGRTTPPLDVRSQCATLPVHTRRILLSSLATRSLTGAHGVPLYPFTLAVTASLAAPSSPALHSPHPPPQPYTRRLLLPGLPFPFKLNFILLSCCVKTLHHGVLSTCNGGGWPLVPSMFAHVHTRSVPMYPSTLTASTGALVHNEQIGRPHPAACA